MALRRGDRVHQATYGVGEILEMNHEYVTIAFDDGSTRKFVASKVLLQPSDTPPPPTAALPRSRRPRTPKGRSRPQRVAS